MGLQIVGHDWVTSLSLHFIILAVDYRYGTKKYFQHILQEPYFDKSLEDSFRDCISCWLIPAWILLELHFYKWSNPWLFKLMEGNSTIHKFKTRTDPKGINIWLWRSLYNILWKQPLYPPSSVAPDLPWTYIKWTLSGTQQWPGAGKGHLSLIFATFCLQSWCVY